VDNKIRTEGVNNLIYQTLKNCIIRLIINVHFDFFEFFMFNFDHKYLYLYYIIIEENYAIKNIFKP
jgi:hypothetical protein